MGKELVGGNVVRVDILELEEKKGSSEIFMILCVDGEICSNGDSVNQGVKADAVVCGSVR